MEYMYWCVSVTWFVNTDHITTHTYTQKWYKNKMWGVLRIATQHDGPQYSWNTKGPYTVTTPRNKISSNRSVSTFINIF
jgi:hypothetical protein